MKINKVSCYHIEQGSKSVCGAFANRVVKMPNPIPDMPVCDKHWPIYDDEAKRLVFMKIFYDWMVENEPG